MRKLNALAIGAIALGMAIGSAKAQAQLSCEQQVRELNQFLSEHGQPAINDVNALANVLRQIKRYERLPSHYITIDEAKRQGWSGRSSDSLWGLSATNRKLIGGEPFRGSSLPSNVQWRSADIDVSRGYRGHKRLIYSVKSSKRFVTVDEYQHFVELSPCN